MANDSAAQPPRFSAVGSSGVLGISDTKGATESTSIETTHCLALGFAWICFRSHPT
jgi:hypothetical protein